MDFTLLLWPTQIVAEPLQTIFRIGYHIFSVAFKYIHVLLHDFC